MYKDEARKLHLEEMSKEETLSPAGKLMLQLLGYLEGVQYIEEQMTKELSIENLQYDRSLLISPSVVLRILRSSDRFYKKVSSFKSKYCAKVEICTVELVEAAKAIYDEFVADHATHQVRSLVPHHSTMVEFLICLLHYSLGEYSCGSLGKVRQGLHGHLQLPEGFVLAIALSLSLSLCSSVIHSSLFRSESIYF